MSYRICVDTSIDKLGVSGILRTFMIDYKTVHQAQPIFFITIHPLLYVYKRDIDEFPISS